MYQSLISFPRALAGLFATLLCLSACYLRAADVPASAAVGGPTTYPGGSLKGEYWKRTPVSILTDGVGNRADGIDNQIATFGTPDGTFKATVFTYLGNDLTQVQTWLGADGASYSGISSNLDDGAFRLTGFINVAAPGPITLGTTSDDGARIKVGGVDISNGDGSHGDETHDADANFAAAGLYPIEVTYFNGDWTSDGTGANLNHSGNPDPSVHGGANFHLRVAGAERRNQHVFLRRERLERWLRGQPWMALPHHADVALDP